ncbi:MAG TPA: glycosyl hydrolase family 28 protein [Verrucomicrobiae bacterium]|nr:glycosyl hydrolase family 28 protein [Verrucomicrobiae bacterium]
MTDSTAPLSRRNWLGIVSSASVGAGLLATNAEAEPTSNSSDHTLGAHICNIRDFGAKGDGVTLDTAALQAAIDTCTKDQGGTVLVPAGTFVVGTVEIKSNVTLHIAAGGKLLGTADGKQYHAADSIPLQGDSTLEDGNVGLIYAIKAENITIEGPGTIDGNGKQFLHGPNNEPSPAGLKSHERPYHLLFYQCTNVRVRDISLLSSAYHSVRVIQSEYLWFTGIHIHSRMIHNADGFHFISACHVHLSDSTIECQDDACALFGSCQFVTVTNCSFSTRWSVFRFGGGTAQNIAVSNCLIYDTFGCPIKIHCTPGAHFENMSFSNLVMQNVTGPISIGLGSRRRAMSQSTGTETNTLPVETPETRPPGICRNISFSGIHAVVTVPVPLADVPFTSKYNPGEIKSCIGLNAVGGVIENISFSDVQITFPGGGTAEEAAVRDVPKIIGEYYAAGVFPAYAFYARNVHGLTLSNVRFEVAGPEARPAVVFDHVEDAAVNGLNAQGTKEAESLLRFIDSRDVLLSASRLLAPTPVFLQVEGGDSSGITIDGGDLSKAGSPFAFKAGGEERSVKYRG